MLNYNATVNSFVTGQFRGVLQQRRCGATLCATAPQAAQRCHVPRPPRGSPPAAARVRNQVQLGIYLVWVKVNYIQALGTVLTVQYYLLRY